jgi:hypothetical protein
MSWWKAMTALALLGGCAELGIPAADSLARGGPVGVSNLFTDQQRAFDAAFTEAPLSRGALAVVASENGNLSTYSLVPCQRAAVCGGSAQGPAGRLFRTPEYTVVDGLYGRRFWLGYGGDGYIERQGTYVPLAWDARPNGQGAGFDPVLETPFGHH